MMVLALLALGVLMSAFFSGSETGFYRVTRVRLMMDAMSGSLIARSLMWLAARPTLVVATVLIGNNIANYLVSYALVLASQQYLAAWGESLHALVPILATPFLFIYGELLPKYLYYNAPYYLSTRGAPLLVFCAALFLPISIFIIAVESVWLHLVGGKSVRFRYSLERQELQRVMMEGQEAGILKPVQRELTQNLFTYGVRPVRQFALPLRALPLAREGASREEILSLATRSKQKYVGVLDPTGKRLIGCYAVGDIILRTDQLPQPLRICQVQASDSILQVLSQMQAHACPLARIVDSRGNQIGVVSRERLSALILSET
jgi:putative hemolysin